MTPLVPAETLASCRLDVAVIGAGIVGLAAAEKLAAAGRRVALIDREGVALGASFGNAGALAFSDILPLASAGKLRRLPRWLLDPLGPLSLPPAYLPSILPWLVRFWRAGWPDRLGRGIAAQAALMRLSACETDATVAACGLGGMLRAEGSLELYESERELAAGLPGWRAREAEGIAFTHVRGVRLAELQPGLSPRFVVGSFVPQWRTVSDPHDFAVALAASLQARGVVFARGDVLASVPRSGGVRLALRSGATIEADAVVIAAGAWARPLARALGDRIPLDTERGYNTTLPSSAFNLRRQLIFGGHGFVVTPLATGIRVGGAVEFGGLRRAPDFRRSQAMLRKAAAFLPGLATTGGRQWMGFRPSLPDSLPVIGAARASPRIVYAFGHGHLGLTQAAGTGRLVAELLCGQPASIDLAPFDPRRFGGAHRHGGNAR